MVLLTGATGFLGQRVARRLAATSQPLAALVRSGSDASVLERFVSELRVGDLRDGESIRAALKGVRILVHVASMGLGTVPETVRLVEEAGLEWALYIGSTSIFTALPPEQKQRRLEAEEAIREGGVPAVILRPTMIYGAPGDRNMERLLRQAASWRVVPVVGSPERLHQPVHVEDVADAVGAALERRARGLADAYQVGGPRPLSYRQLLDEVCDALGKRFLRVRLPLAPARLAIGLYSRVSSRPRIRADQIARLEEDRAYDIAATRRDLDYAPRSFADGIRQEAAMLGLAASARRDAT